MNRTDAHHTSMNEKRLPVTSNGGVYGSYNEDADYTASGESSPTENEPFLAVGAAGRLPEEVYERTLSGWRNAIRKTINIAVARESVILAKMQLYIRHPLLDTYFVYTSFLGTHTFFMILLPALFFFGHAEVGTRLISTLALGVYVTSFVKDLICAPRPHSPPVTRFIVGSHHLEYGFPSTHSTNSVSIALMFFSLLRNKYIANVSEAAVSPLVYYVLSSILVFYVFSVVYGRLYTGMHSITDCVAGVTFGVLTYFFDAKSAPYVDAWLANNTWSVPLVIIPVCLLMVHWHPQPIDDCPCFEDAIAFNSVVMGMLLSRWYMMHHGIGPGYSAAVMPGSTWATPFDVAQWTAFAVMKLVLGILTIFVWRILAKALFHELLPPTFRLLSTLVTLPHRRFYTPATDYARVPAEHALRPVPSVIDLPHMMELQNDEGGASGRRYPGWYGGAANGTAAVKMRGGKGKEEKGARERMAVEAEMESNGGNADGEVKHYDADVLTKVFVYCGIAVLATGIVPVVFEVLGWGGRT